MSSPRRQVGVNTILVALLCAASLYGQAPPNPVPLINQPLVPTSVAPGSAGFTLTVNGTGFVPPGFAPGSVVNWNGSPRTTTYVNSRQLTASITAGDVAFAGTASVTVVNPGPGGGTSNVAFCHVTTSTTSVSMSKTDYATGAIPGFVETQDFNGDGQLDLAVANSADNTVSILLGNLDGTFQTQTTFATGITPLRMTTADFNGDGKLDLAVANVNDNTVSILLGNGDGTFQTQTPFATGAFPHSVTTGDFNGDGKLDLAVANRDNSTVSILLGNGDGTFQAQITFVTGSSPQFVTTGDFNGDGKLDLAVANGSDNTVSILLGNGDGTFQAQTTFATGLGPAPVNTADFNADGKLDLAVANGSDNTVSILLGNGDGTFQTQTSFAAGVTPASVTAKDFNGDGKLDLAVANGSDNTVSILLGNGDGTFQTQTTFATGSTPLSVTTGDFNGDGRPDLAVANLFGNTVSVLLQIAPAVQLSTSSLNFAARLVNTASPAQSVTLTNNGTATLNFTSFNVQLSTGNTTASPDFSSNNNCGTSLGTGLSCTINVFFTPTALGPLSAVIKIVSDAPGSPHYINLTGTGVSGGVVTGLPTSLTFANLLVGTTSASQTVTITNTGTAPLGITSVVASGNFALVPSSNPCGTSLAVGLSCDISVVFNPLSPGINTGELTITNDGAGSPNIVNLSGTGTVTAVNPLVAFTPKTDYTTGTSPLGVASGDFNGDGKNDLVTTNYASNSVSVFRGNGDGTFQSGVQYSVGTGPHNLSVADLNGDNKLDLAVGTQNCPSGPPTISVLLGNGDGTFQTALSPAAGLGANHVAPGDFDGDGKIDLAVALGGCGAGSTISVLIGNGDGTYQSPVTYGAGLNPASIATRDFNGDGNLDLAVVNNIGSLSILLGNGNGTFQPATNYSTGGFPNGNMGIADFNGDSALDVAVAEAGSNSVGVFLGNGDGTFRARVGYAVPGARGVAAADFNSDGRFDLAVAGQSAGKVSILLGNGDGTFRPKVDFVTTSTPTGVAAADFNGDGMPDLAVAGSLSVLLNTAALFSSYNLTFGNLLVGTTSAEQTITLTNASNSVNLNVGGITPSGDFVDTIQTCTSTPLAPGASCTINATFTPVALGARTGSLSVSTNAIGSPHIISLTGNGTGTPAVTLGPAVNFTGNPLNLTCPTKAVTLTNTGDIALDIASIAASAPFSQTNACPATLGVGASCIIQVKFAPTVVGSASGTLTVTTSPATTGNTVALTGNGTPACSLLAKVRSVTVLRGTDAQDFAIEDAKPSCSPVELNLTCSVDNPAACLLSPAVIAPSGASTLKVSNLRRVAAEALQVTVTSTSEFRQATELVTVRFADFAMTKSPEAATVAAGGVATYALAIRPVNGLSGNVALACSGAPIRSGCAVEPSSVALDGTSLAQVKVKVTTTSGAGALPPMNVPSDWARRVVPSLLVALLTLMLGALVEKSRRVKESAAADATRAVAPVGACPDVVGERRVRAKLVLAAAMLLMLVWASCGGGGGSMNFGSSATPAGNYTLTITGTYSSASGPTPGTLANSTTVNLKVN